MIDLLGPVRKLFTVGMFIAFFVAANAALLYVTSSCVVSTDCIGTGGVAGVVSQVRKYAGVFLPYNFYACLQCMLLGEIMLRAYKYAMTVADVSAKAS